MLDKNNMGYYLTVGKRLLDIMFCRKNIYLWCFQGINNQSLFTIKTQERRPTYGIGKFN